MATHIFHEGPLPSDTTLDFEPALFNASEYRMLQPATPWLSYYALDPHRKMAVASMHFALENGIARSPYKAPFGSVECAVNISPTLLYEFLEYVELQLKKQSALEISIKNPPRAYQPDLLSLLETLLINRKFSLAVAEISAVIPVTEMSFTEHLRHSERLRYKQVRAAGLQLERPPIDNLDEVYNFISRCHSEKGYKLSISLAELTKIVVQFPDRYLLFTVRDNGKVVAASISVRIKKDILYNFLVNHDRDYDSVSPPILLMEGLYQYCRDNGVLLFDLGTSAYPDKPNFPLLDFKLRIGGLPTSKFTFVKSIN